MVGVESDCTAAAAAAAAVELEAEAAGDGGGAAELGLTFNKIEVHLIFSDALGCLYTTPLNCTWQTLDATTTTKFLSFILYSLRAVSSSRILPKKKQKGIQTYFA